MQTVKRLHDLQRIDLKVDELEGVLADVRARLEDDSAITSASARLTALSEALDEIGVGRRAAERAIAETQERLKSIEKKLYGGAITSLDEMTAAEEERKFVVEQLREQEDNLLELMVQTEDGESAQSEAREALSELKSGRPAEQARLQESERRTAAELDECRRQRDDAAPRVSADLIALYESLRKSTNGSPVARIERGMCQGCRLTLSTMELQRARTAPTPVRCSSCKRILYLP
jgi:predicted  nucleic acid-binding Zn-ribbon protein